MKNQNKKEIAVGFLLNMILPGMGTIANKEIKKGVIQKSIFFLSIILFFLSIIPIVVLVAGFNLNNPTNIDQAIADLSRVLTILLPLIIISLLGLFASYLWGIIDYLIKLKRVNSKNKTLDKRLSIIGLIYNIILPGLGTFIAGNNKTGLKQIIATIIVTIIPLIGILMFGLFAVGLLFLLITIIVIGNIATRIWAIVTSVSQIQESPRNTTPTNFDYITGLYLNIATPGIGTIVSNHKKLGLMQYIMGVIASFFGTIILYTLYDTDTLYTPYDILYIIIFLWATIFSAYKIVTKVNKKSKTIEKRWAVEGLFTNLFVPGLGTIVGGETDKGIKTFISFALAIIMGGTLTLMSGILLQNNILTQLFMILMILTILTTWTFGIITSIKQIQKSK